MARGCAAHLPLAATLSEGEAHLQAVRTTHEECVSPARDSATATISLAAPGATADDGLSAEALRRPRRTGAMTGAVDQDQLV